MTDAIPQRFRPGDVVRCVGGNAAHLMSVRAASSDLVLCVWFAENGRRQHAPYQAEELELVQAATDQGPG